MWTGSRTGPLIQNRLPVKKEHKEKRGTSIPAFRGNMAKTSGFIRLAGATARSATNSVSAFKRMNSKSVVQPEAAERRRCVFPSGH